MKLLRINGSAGEFLAATGDYQVIDSINKDDLLRLVDLTLANNDAEFDAYDEQLIKNQAHQVIYKSICQKLVDLGKRREEFSDEFSRIFLEDYEKYKNKS